MIDQEIVIVVARALNGVIGIEGRLPWRSRADMAQFRSVTANCPMVMGRRTFESLPGLLGGRRHVVLTRDEEWKATGAEVSHSVDEVRANLADQEKYCVIGGVEVIQAFEPYATTIHLTEVQAEPIGDTVLPAFDTVRWREVGRARLVQGADEPRADTVILKRRPK